MKPKKRGGRKEEKNKNKRKKKNSWLYVDKADRFKV
jgi:hypothetical protein